jgi:ribosomal protein S18 acetylase RimI-like enzyme
VRYKTLKNVSLETLCETFNKAFSDYQIDMQMSIIKFDQMISRKGYDPEVSVGVFDGNDLIGFVLNGLRKIDRKWAAYDLGTGIISEYRDKGISNKMLRYNEDILRERNIRQYILEVLKNNPRAIEVYRNRGFEATREFTCYEIDKNEYDSKKCDHNVETRYMTFDDWNYIKEFWDGTPSWQNSNDSIASVKELFKISTVLNDDKIVGYGVIDIESGDIPQLAVDPEYRGRGIGRSILSDLIKGTRSDNIRVINIDDENLSSQEFLTKLGFQEFASQYEMKLDLF